MSLFKQQIRWKKEGVIIRVRPEFWWMRTHTMVPTVEHLSGTLYKVYFSGRDDKNRSHIGYVVIDFHDPGKILEISEEPVLAPGALGCFDDNGVTPSSVVTVGDRKFLYYLGWNPGSTVRMHLFGGLAISSDNGKSFERYSRAPIIERNRYNPYLNTAPYVLHENGTWKMYYVSGTEWVRPDLPRYNIQYATSVDGMHWDRKGHVCIDFKDATENALARPCVLHEDGVYKMWFGHKGENYRLGYAESLDGMNWTRNDRLAGLDVSASGWDSEMIEYAAVFNCGGRKHMLYNGNGYGRDGIGLAVEV